MSCSAAHIFCDTIHNFYTFFSSSKSFLLSVFSFVSFQSVVILQRPNSNLFWSEGIHRLKQSMPKRKVGKMAKSYDPIAPVAEEISEEACLLCFDEFQVNIVIVSWRGKIISKII